VLASTWMDMVIGVDIHFEMVPTPAGPIPTPFPNPFIGIVLDPAGLATGLALGAALALATGGTPTGPVLINCMPATNVGTEAKGMGHILIPPGVAWVPMPKFPKPSFRGPPEFPGLPVKPEDDAISIMGSTTVTIMGSSAVRMGELWMSCGEPLRLPSSAVIAIPKGPLVLVGGPPGVNLLDALLAMIKTKWVAGYLHSLISRVKNARLRNILNKAACFLTGHPVDVANGRLLTDNVDFELPGPLPLTFERNYASSWADRDGPLGPGWSHSLDQAVWFERGKAVYLAEDGREIEFDTFDLPDHALGLGQQVYEPINQLTLRFKRRDCIEIETHLGETLEFSPSRVRTGSVRDSWWRLQKRRTRAGHEIALSYDERGNLSWVKDSGGRVVSFEHNAQGRLTCIRLPHPTQEGFVEYVRYAYDAEGDLVQVTDALGASWTFAYKRHLMVRETNRNGLSFYFAYDGWSADAYCVRTWGDGGIYDHVIDYAKGTMTVVTNSLGHKRAYKLNALGLVVEVFDAAGGTTKYEYDERTLKLTKLVDPSGNETSTEYDARGNPVKIVRADATEVLIEYSDRNHPTRLRDPLGGEWRWTYDSVDRLIGRSDPVGRRVQFHWGESGLVGYTDEAGQYTRFVCDAAGNVTSVLEPNGTTFEWTYDRLGRTLTQTDPRRNVQRRHRDILGRLWRVEESDGEVREARRDAEGNVLHSRDRHHEVRFEYRGMNRLAARMAGGVRVEFDYDTEENLIGLKNEHGLAYRFEMDPAGRVVHEYGFDGLRWSYQRDSAGRILSVERAGKLTRYAYDALGHVLSAKHSDGTSEEYGYRADGALTSAQNQAIKLLFERDALGRVVKEHQGVDWVSSEYDSLGRRARVRSSKGLDQHIRRNGMGHVQAVDATLTSDVAEGNRTGGLRAPSTNLQIVFERDQLGLELQRSLPGGVRARWQRDAYGKPVRQEIWKDQSQVGARHYVWDGDERLQRIIDAMTGPIDFHHDVVGNLAVASSADGRVDLRMPDAVGNLFKTSDRSDRSYGPAGQLLSARSAAGVTHYEYDATGNLVKKVEPGGSVWTYHWSARGLLEKVVRPTGDEVSFQYDALGRRISKSYRGKTTRWIWDENLPLHEWVEAAVEAQPSPASSPVTARLGQRSLAALLAARPAVGPPMGAPAAPVQISPAEGTAAAPITWLFEPDTFAPLAKLVGEERFSVVTDHLGTPVALFNAKGAEVWGAELDTYSQCRNVRGERNACPFRFAGQYEDEETGLYYNRFRYYDRDAGTFISQDPLRLVGGDRFYAYPGDPLLQVDPLGLVAAPASLPNTPGVYIITNGNTAYVGSAGIGAQGMSDRISDVSHSKAQGLLGQPGTKVEFVPVDLGTATSLSDRNNILRKFEQAELDRVKAANFDVLNSPGRIQAVAKGPKANALVAQHGASAGERQTCS